MCWLLDNLCGSVRGLAGSGVLNCMYCCVLVFGHFVWECEGVSREWRNEFKFTFLNYFHFSVQKYVYINGQLIELFIILYHI